MISDNVYIINFKRLIKYLDATFLRKAKYVGYMLAAAAPLKSLYNVFLGFKDDAIYKVSHNSQICYMQKVLNDSFDDDLRRIVIKNAIIFEPSWFYHPEDNKPLFFYNEADNLPVYFYNPQDFLGDGVDFTVIVPLAIKPITPAEVITFETKMRAQIDYYKLYSKNYIIKYE